MLVDSLTSSFTADGSFDFENTMNGLIDATVTAEFGEITFDPADALAAVALLAPPELADVLSLVGDIAGSTELSVADLVDPETLLAPLRDLIAPLDAFDGGLDAIDIDAVDGGIGLLTIGDRLDQVFSLLDGEPLGAIVNLLREFVPDIDIAGGVQDITGWIGGAVGVVQLVGGLLAVESVTSKISAHADLVAGMLNAPQASADGELLARLAASDMATRITSLDPADRAAAETLLAELNDFVIAIRNVQESWAEGLGLGEAALIGLDATGCGVQLRTARAALDEALLAHVRALGTNVRVALDPVLAIQLPDPRDTLDDTFDGIIELISPLRDAIEGLDSSRLTETIGGAITAVTAPIDEVVSTLDATATTVTGALAAVGDLVQSVDLGPIASGVADALEPVTNVLDTIDVAISTGQDAIEAVAAAIESTLAAIAAAVAAVADQVNGALQALFDRLDDVEFEKVQTAIENGLGAVAARLASAELAPYFDAANDVIDTTTDVIDAVPFGLLPTGIQQEIVDLSKPVKAIDFDAIAQTLRDEFDAIMKSLDEDVLADVDAAYQQIVAFLASIDPGAAIAEFEVGPLAELRATVDSIDPETILADVDAAIVPVRSLLARIDLRSEILDPIGAVFGEIRGGLDALDPADLLADVVAEVDDFRERIADGIHLEEWRATLDDSRQRIVELLDRIDIARLAEVAAAGAIARLRNRPDLGPGPLGQIVATLVQSSGLAADADAWPAVRRWFNDPLARDTAARLAAAAADLERTTLAVRALAPEPLVSAAQAQHRRALQAVQSLPSDHVLRVLGEPLLVDNSPTVVLAPLIDNRTRYLARLDADTGAIAQLATTATSQVGVVCDGLVDALLPVTGLSEWLRSLLERFGLDVIDRPWQELLADLLDELGPDRILPLLVEVVDALTAKLIEIVDSVFVPAQGVVDTIEAAIGLIDLAPIVDELSGIHAGIAAIVDGIDPAVLLGPTIDEADALVARVAAYDPLAPVRTVIDALRATIDDLFESATPSVVFAPAIDIYDTIVGLAEGLDVRGLLQPILDALASLVVDLDEGIEGTAGALTRLQAALPDSVEDPAASVGDTGSGGLSL